MKILAFGEILFDVYPAGQKLGGAPLNFCAHSTMLGAEGYLLSCVGNDDRGLDAIKAAESFGINTKYMTKSDTVPTGMCMVTYEGTEPMYDLSMESAYEFITVPDINQIKAEKFDILYFGTLAQRSDVSKQTLEDLLSQVSFPTVFFDMNLRQHYYSEELIKTGLKYADIIKINRSEYDYLKSICCIGAPDTYEVFLPMLCDDYGIKTVIFTLDSDGAVIYDVAQGFFSAPAADSEFVSAVGAGDSFCACFLYNYLKGASIDQCLERANTLAGFVVSVEAAIPAYPKELFNRIQ